MIEKTNIRASAYAILLDCLLSFKRFLIVMQKNHFFYYYWNVLLFWTLKFWITSLQKRVRRVKLLSHYKTNESYDEVNYDSQQQFAFVSHDGSCVVILRLLKLLETSNDFKRFNSSPFTVALFYWYPFYLRYFQTIIYYALSY